jgi:hypothetical protein
MARGNVYPGFNHRARYQQLKMHLPVRRGSKLSKTGIPDVSQTLAT